MNEIHGAMPASSDAHFSRHAAGGEPAAHCQMQMDAAGFRNVTRLGSETEHDGLCAPGLDAVSEPWGKFLSVCPFLPDLGIRHMGIVKAARDYCFERENPLQPLFLATLRGTGYAGTPPTLSLLSAGHGILLPDGCPRRYFNASEQDWQFVWICFERPDCLVTGTDMASFELDAEVFQQSMVALTSCWKRYGSAATTLRMMEGLLELVKLHLGVRPELEKFHAAWRTVIANLGAKWELEHIARLSGCSPESFRRLCWSVFGSSPMKHLTQLRLLRARVMLTSTSASIQEIADLFGYSDAYAFSHAFKRCYGVSPSAFRSGDSGE